MRDLAVDGLGDLGGSEEGVRPLGVGLGPAPEVRELGEDQAVVGVHRAGHLAVGADDRVVVIGDLPPRGGRRRRVDARGAAEDREGAAAARLGLVIVPETLRRPAALGHGLGMSRGVDAVPERDGADPDRREERAKVVGHVSLPRWPAAIRCQATTGD